MRPATRGRTRVFRSRSGGSASGGSAGRGRSPAGAMPKRACVNSGRNGGGAGEGAVAAFWMDKPVDGAASGVERRRAGAFRRGDGSGGSARFTCDGAVSERPGGERIGGTADYERAIGKLGGRGCEFCARRRFRRGNGAIAIERGAADGA